MFSDPVKNVEQCGIQAGQEIADFGSGSGRYSIAAGKALMATGKVYAIDVQRDLLTRLRNIAVRDGIHNIEVVLGNVEKINGTKLHDNSIDLVFLCTILFQLDDKEIAIKEAKRVLRPGGRILFIEWADSFGGIGPKPEAVIKKNDISKIFEKNGFHLDREISAGSHHYGLIYKKL